MKPIDFKKIAEQVGATVVEWDHEDSRERVIMDKGYYTPHIKRHITFTRRPYFSDVDVFMVFWEIPNPMGHMPMNCVDLVIADEEEILRFIKHVWG